MDREEITFFRHDYDSLNDDKILQMRGEFGLEGYGLFWMCLETMAKNKDGVLKATLIGGLSLGYGVVKEKLQKYLEYCVDVKLMYKKNDGFCSTRMDSHKKWIKSLSDAGKRGVQKKKEIREANSPPCSPPVTKKEKKEKKVVVVEIISPTTKYFEKNFPGTVSSTEYEEIDYLGKKYGEDNVIEAMKRAILQKKKTLAYVRGILVNENEQGFAWNDNKTQQEPAVFYNQC